jgi:hypothetical protein
MLMLCITQIKMELAHSARHVEWLLGSTMSLDKKLDSDGLSIINQRQPCGLWQTHLCLIRGYMMIYDVYMCLKHVCQVTCCKALNFYRKVLGRVSLVGAQDSDFDN